MPLWLLFKQLINCLSRKKERRGQNNIVAQMIQLQLQQNWFKMADFWIEFENSLLFFLKFYSFFLSPSTTLPSTTHRYRQSDTIHSNTARIVQHSGKSFCIYFPFVFGVCSTKEEISCQNHRLNNLSEGRKRGIKLPFRLGDNWAEKKQ